MRNRIAAALVSAACAVALVPGSANAAGAATPGFAAPGAFQTGYATPRLVTQVGGSLVFINADVAPHDIRSTAMTSGPNPVPLFQSDVINIGQTSEVRGLDRVRAGESYEFFCVVHPNMRGTLVVSPV